MRIVLVGPAGDIGRHEHALGRVEIVRRVHDILVEPVGPGQAAVEEIVGLPEPRTFERHLEAKILKALFTNHVYEEVAYEIYDLRNKHQNIGLGMIGELETSMGEADFLNLVKDKMKAEGIRHSAFTGRKVKKVAVLGGSGSFAISKAIAEGADVFLTADLKYHQFYEAEGKLVLADIGHFESERYTKNYIVDYLTKKIPNFAIILSQENTNPVKYL